MRLEPRTRRAGEEKESRRDSRRVYARCGGASSISKEEPWRETARHGVTLECSKRWKSRKEGVCLDACVASEDLE